MRNVSALVNSTALMAKALRFAIVGIMSSGFYAIITMLARNIVGADPKIASALGYVASIPLNFLFHRHFSFQSKSSARSEVIRYGLVHLGNIVLTTTAMMLIVDVIKIHYFFGIAAAIIFVPIINFIVMNWWVFRKLSTMQPPKRRSSEEGLTAQLQGPGCETSE